MKKLVAFGFLVLLLPLFLYSQFLNNTSVQLILKGKVYDEYTGNPVGAIIEFRTTTGKKFKIKSDSVSGEYSQVFNSGDKIEVIIYDWDVVREKFSVQLPDTNKYAEIEQNFKVKHLKEGLVAYRFNCFETGSAEISPDCKANLLSLDEVLRFNRNVKFEIQVTAFDTYYKTKRKQKNPKSSYRKEEEKKLLPKRSKQSKNRPQIKSKIWSTRDYHRLNKLLGKYLEAKVGLRSSPFTKVETCQMESSPSHTKSLLS